MSGQLSKFGKPRLGVIGRNNSFMTMTANLAASSRTFSKTLVSKPSKRRSKLPEPMPSVNVSSAHSNKNVPITFSSSTLTNYTESSRLMLNTSISNVLIKALISIFRLGLTNLSRRQITNSRARSFRPRCSTACFIVTATPINCRSWRSPQTKIDRFNLNGRFAFILGCQNNLLLAHIEVE